MAFTGLTNTTAKTALMAAVLLFQFRRTVRGIDGSLVALAFFLMVYSLFWAQAMDAPFAIYQVMTFPVFAYLLGKSFAQGAPDAGRIVFGLFSVSLAIAYFPTAAVIADIMAGGFAMGSRRVYVVSLDLALSATLLGGLLTLGLSQSAAVMVGGFRQQRILFTAALVTTVIMVIVALRLGSRTQIMVLLLCLVVGSLLRSSGAYWGWKKVGVGIVAIALVMVASDHIPAFIASDLGIYYRDRVGDAYFGWLSMGGRIERWVDAVGRLGARPMGWSLSESGYAHNMWLDVARVSGWFGLFALLLFTVVHLRAVHCNLRALDGSRVKISLLLALFGANALFMVEPIMDGLPYVFYAYCAVVGMATGTRAGVARDRVC